jgi:hypothetical protein
MSPSTAIVETRGVVREVLAKMSKDKNQSKATDKEVGFEL